MIYFPTGKTTTLNLKGLGGKTYKVWWYDPRTGASFLDSEIEPIFYTADPPSSGIGNDWVLVLDEVDSKLDAPGVVE